MVRDEFLRVNTEKYIAAIFSFYAVAGKQFRRLTERKHELLGLLSNKPSGPGKLNRSEHN
jgi:hypothetical protein